MPEIISRAFQESPIMLQWYSWGVIVSFLVALGATIWVFADAQRTGQDATVWKSLAAVASVLAVPALLARIHGGFAFEMRDSLSLVAFLSMAAMVLALVVAIAYGATRSQAERCPVCGQPQEPGWAQCPYHQAPQLAASAGPQVPLTPITDVAPPEPSGFRPEKETLVGQQNQSPFNPFSPMPGKQTVILTRDESPKALALLVITSGPYANTTLPLKAGVTRIGRAGSLNDHTIDDDAVSEQHLSIRHQDGVFTATDLDSSNGTTINGKRIDKQTLAPNDVVVVGKTSMVFMQVPDTSPKAAE